MAQWIPTYLVAVFGLWKVLKRMAGFWGWFLTKNGRKFTHACVGLTGFSLFGFKLALNGPLQGKIQEVSQIYNHGKPRPLSSSVRELVNEVIKDAGLTKEERRKIKFFNVVGLELFHSGDVRSPYGALIGLPFYFEELGSINFGQLRILGSDPIDWVIDGQDLLGSLTLSENAKKFAIMREIHSSSIWNAIDSALSVTGAFLFGAVMSRLVNKRRNLYEKPLSTRLKVYFTCFAGAYIIYRCVQDPTKHIGEKKSDRLAAATGPEYLDGGIEFYQKALDRNKAMRVLLGAKGEKMYDEKGNENYFIISPRLPIRRRLENLLDQKKEKEAASV